MKGRVWHARVVIASMKTCPLMFLKEKESTNVRFKGAGSCAVYRIVAKRAPATNCSRTAFADAQILQEHCDVAL